MSNPPPAYPRPVIHPIAHGTLSDYQGGCRCGICASFAVALRAGTSPPPATAKPATARRRAGRGWTVRCEPVGFAVANGDAPDRAHILQDGEVVCHWTGVAGVLVCTEATWELIERDNGAITAMQEAQEEAKRAMPKAVVRDVAVAAGGVVEREEYDPRKPPKPTGGIGALQSQIRTLVEEMSRFPHPTAVQQKEFARRYGALRDRMARHRREFLAAEGAFEVAQAQIIAFMNQED